MFVYFNVEVSLRKYHDVGDALRALFAQTKRERETGGGGGKKKEGAIKLAINN